MNKQQVKDLLIQLYWGNNDFSVTQMLIMLDLDPDVVGFQMIPIIKNLDRAKKAWTDGNNEEQTANFRLALEEATNAIMNLKK